MWANVKQKSTLKFSWQYICACMRFAEHAHYNDDRAVLTLSFFALAFVASSLWSTKANSASTAIISFSPAEGPAEADR